MFTQSYYLLRSTQDGQYLVARPRENETKAASNGYLILFTADYDALSYVNTHGAAVAHQFAVEPISGNQLKLLMQRWGFAGMGMVKDPLLPTVEFLSWEPSGPSE